MSHAKDIIGFKDVELKNEKFRRKRIRVKEVIEHETRGEVFIGKEVTMAGWARTVRYAQKNTLAFIALNDGSCFGSVQVVASKDTTENFEELTTCGGIGASIKVVGEIVDSPNKKNQAVELSAKTVIVLGKVDPVKYPLKKTKHAHSMEFLRKHAHLRPRTNLIGAVARVRNAMAYATHRFFQERGFLYINTPLITGSDGEGAGEMFAVTTLIDNLESSQKEQKKKTESEAMEDLSVSDKKKIDIDYSKDFFSRQAFLTVTGQLNVETYSVGMSDVYTFGPTFRAENSHTSRHLAEFWMIEPELAFTDLPDLINVAEDYIKYCIAFGLENCKEDLKFFDLRVEKGIIDRLKNVLENDFIRLTYTEAIDILLKPEHLKKGKFEEKPYWGIDLGSEHERYLTEQVYKKPVIVVNYPASFKAFYMKRNDEKVSAGGQEHYTVQGMDMLVPKIGELLGGSVREERLSVLEELMDQKKLDKEHYSWYLDLRRYGTVPHSGFGLGFERLIMFMTGVENIRDVIPFPRTPGNCEF